MNQRVIAACLLRFFEIGALVAALGYANIGLLSHYPLSVLPLYYFSQGVVSLLMIFFGPNVKHKNPQTYAFAYHGSISVIIAILYGLILMEIPWAVFVACVFMSSMAFQTISVIGNTISLAFDIREFRRFSRALVIAASSAGIFFALFFPLLIGTLGGAILIPTSSILYLACLGLSTQLKPLNESQKLNQDIKPIKNRFFLLILGYAIALLAASLLIDYSYKFVLRENFDPKMIGIIATSLSGFTYILVILMQMYAQKKFLESFGVIGLLVVVPIGLILLSLLTIFSPTVAIVLLITSLFTVFRDGVIYVAYQILLNALPQMMRIIAKSQLTSISSIVGRVLIVSPFLWLLGEQFASIRVLMMICLIFYLIALFLIFPIKKLYFESLKTQVEQKRVLQNEGIFSLDNFVTENIHDVIPQIGHRYSVYEALAFFKTRKIDPIPYLMKDLSSVKDIVNFEGRVSLLNKVEEEAPFIALLKCKLAILPNALPLTLAIRALNFGLSPPLHQAITTKLKSESNTIISLKQAITIEPKDHLRLEMKSRLDLATIRFYYYFASLSNTGAVLNTIPKLINQPFEKLDQLKWANAIDYLEVITDDTQLKKLLLDTMEDDHSIASPEQIAEVISQDPWLSQIQLMESFKPGANMNHIEKALFLRRIPLFESLSAEALELVSELLSEKFIKENEVVFKEGDQPDNAYFVVSGVVMIKKGDRELSQISQYGLFGELGLLDDCPRVGTASATTDVVLLCIHKQEFNQLIMDIPEIGKSIILQLLGYLRSSHLSFTNK